MTKEKKQEYTLRITQANASALVVILYEMFFDYADEAKDALEQQDLKAFNEAMDKCSGVLGELILSLNHEQDLADTIYRIYLYVSARLGQARGSRDCKLLEDPLRFMHSLYETYKKDSACDTSGPVMDNSQKVYAGLTYGKGDLTETMDEGMGSRGFFV